MNKHKWGVYPQPNERMEESLLKNNGFMAEFDSSNRIIGNIYPCHAVDNRHLNYAFWGGGGDGWLCGTVSPPSFKFFLGPNIPLDEEDI